MIWQIIKNYFIHLEKNWLVAGRALYLFFTHLLHGMLPFPFTSHDWLEVKIKKKIKKQKKINYEEIIFNIISGIFIFVGIYLVVYFLFHIKLYGYGFGGIALILIGLFFLAVRYDW